MNALNERSVTAYDRALEGVVISYAQKHHLKASSPAFADEVRSAMAEDIMNISGLLAARYNVKETEVLDNLSHAIANAAKTLNLPQGKVRDFYVKHALAAADTALGNEKRCF